jgi:hypothetical protein
MIEVVLPKDLRAIMDDYYTNVLCLLQNVDQDGKGIYD